jgi:hypothetical protein
MIATQGILSFALIVAFLIGLTLFAMREIKNFHHVEQPARPDQRIPAEEMALTGTDYRDHVAAYFAKRSRQEQIIARSLRQDR